METTFKESKKVKRIRNYVLTCNLYLHFLIQQNLLIFGEKILMPAELKDTSVTASVFETLKTSCPFSLSKIWNF